MKLRSPSRPHLSTEIVRWSCVYGLIGWVALASLFDSHEPDAIGGQRSDFHDESRGLSATPFAAQSTADSGQESADASRRQGLKEGLIFRVQLPITADSADRLVAQLTGRAEGGTQPGGRTTVVLRYESPVGPDGQLDASLAAETQFEDALKLARAITSPELRTLRIVTLVDGPMGGHALLPIMATERLVLGSEAVFLSADTDGNADEMIPLSYQSIAKRRGLFPPAVVLALTDPNTELANVTTTTGSQSLRAGADLVTLRDQGDVLSEDIWKASGQPARLTAEQLRTSRIASDVLVSSTPSDMLESLADRLDLADLRESGAGVTDGDRKAIRLDIQGAIAASKSRRWQSNLGASLSRDGVDTWFIQFDSDGGNLDESAGLASWFANPEPPLRTVIGVVSGEARGDAALIALACDPLYMLPDSTLGGAGADAIDAERVANHREFIESVARRTNRSADLIAGLLDRESQVIRFTNKKTGRVRYATEESLTWDSEDPDTELDRWERGEVIDLSQGLTADQALELGLIDGQVSNLDMAARRSGLAAVPDPISERRIIRFVERIGQHQGFAFLALILGFSLLSSEASAPGLGVPGFLSLLCFGFFFWTQYLAGTAEWLELLAFVLGLTCIAIEIFLVPGFGIFGVGGLALTLLGVVLMSQTFVVPRNVYQVEILTRSIWIALGGLASTIAAFVLMRHFLPHLPIVGSLVMEPADPARIDASERLTNYQHLHGQIGITTTPLRPSGKARFGDAIVAVVSDGLSVEVGQSIRVIEVKGNRVVVEAA